MKKLLFAIGIGIIVTVLFLALAGFFGGACHCVAPTTAFFPYAAIVWGATSWDSVGLILFAVQYPVYAVALSVPRANARRVVFVAVILATHIAGVLIGLKVYHH
jgi:hypothetical protein